MPLSFAPAEAYQFDWSQYEVLINGTTVTVTVAHLRLYHSRMLFMRAYSRRTRQVEIIVQHRGLAFRRQARSQFCG
ncbi:hypothetical protein ASE94_06520 [Devosia sp. Leaf64]|nr:hypothetical protein ASE94_06520 [Devosia sp. Leaf64]